jgi:hypothetical protein
MLTDYQQRVRILLNDSTFARWNDDDFRRWINEARGQIAGEAECIVNYASLTLVSSPAPQLEYPFSDIVIAGTPPTGIAGVLNVRKAGWSFPPDTSVQRMTPREWEWFQNYVLPITPPTAGQPKYWALFGQGAAGTIWVNPPDGPYVLRLDTVCYPSSLMTDADPEALPYQWTDAVPYYAAYLGYVQAQDIDRARAMMQLYQHYMQRARGTATPSVLPHQYRQAPDPMMTNRLGLPIPRAGGQTQ